MYNTVLTTAKTTTAATNSLTTKGLFCSVFLLVWLEIAVWALVKGISVEEVWDVLFFG